MEAFSNFCSKLLEELFLFDLRDGVDFSQLFFFAPSSITLVDPKEFDEFLIVEQTQNRVSAKVVNKFVMANPKR